MNTVQIKGVTVYIAECGVQWAIEPWVGCRKYPQYMEQLSIVGGKTTILTQAVYYNGPLMKLLQELNNTDDVKYAPISKERAEQLAGVAEEFEPVNDWEHYEKSR